MATRCYIGLEGLDGTVRYVYCHWDGYPSGTGKILQEDWNSYTLVSNMINKGNMSYLGRNLGDTEFYCKEGDPNEEDEGAKYCKDVNAYSATAPDYLIEYIYLFKDIGTGYSWFLWEPDKKTWEPLQQVLDRVLKEE
jgi:hypothetical protein